MANPKHLEVLKQEVEVWNKWREVNPTITPDLSRILLNSLDFSHANFKDVDFSESTIVQCNFSDTDLSNAVFSDSELYFVNFIKANLERSKFVGSHIEVVDFALANLKRADLSSTKFVEAVRFVNADLSYANFGEGANVECAIFNGTNLHMAFLKSASLRQCSFREADLSNSNLYSADLRWADLTQANLSRADLYEADLYEAKLTNADLSNADLSYANLNKTDLNHATLKRTYLKGAQLVRAKLNNAILTSSYVFGVSVWGIELENAEQNDLVVTPEEEPTITVDNLQLAQFIYLLLENQKIRDVIDTITSKAVLILGRFTPQRKAILDTIRERLRSENYLPILFDFEVPESRDITETVTLLARMSRFIIADLTEPSSIPKELEAIVPMLAVPVQPLIEGVNNPYSMFTDYWKYHWVLPLHRYEGINELMETLRERIIAPAEAKIRELAEQRTQSIISEST